MLINNKEWLIYTFWVSKVETQDSKSPKAKNKGELMVYVQVQGQEKTDIPAQQWDRQNSLKLLALFRSSIV